MGENPKSEVGMQPITKDTYWWCGGSGFTVFVRFHPSPLNDYPWRVEIQYGVKRLVINFQDWAQVNKFCALLRFELERWAESIEQLADQIRGVEGKPAQEEEE